VRLGKEVLAYGSKSVIDLHSHVLAGIDDGPATIEGSIGIARAAAAGGTRTLVATPHVSWRYPNDPDTITRLVDELNMHLTAEQVTLEVRPGAEIAMAHLADIDPARLPRLGLGGGPWLLIEPPFVRVVSNMDALLLDVQQQGHHILLAHPERCMAFHRDPLMLGSLVHAGVLTSITAGSLVGRFGAVVRRFAMDLVAEGMVHNVASDAHDRGIRSPGILAELDQSGLGGLADWWTREVPAAILSGEERIPPRPPFTVPPGTPRARRRLRSLLGNRRR
jgi:protein-tyrosine phosphatase